jgi:hypothetical protein
MLNADGQWMNRPSTNEVVSVSGSDEADIVSASEPAEFVSYGEATVITVTLENTGTNSWLAGYCLKALQDMWAGAADCVPAGTVVSPGQSRLFGLTVVAPDDPGRHELSYRMVNPDGEAFGHSGLGTIGIAWTQQASSAFSGTQSSGYWWYRYYEPDVYKWKKMTWDTDHWKRGQGEVWSDSMKPKNELPVARFWKSPVNGTVRVSGQVSDLATSCGDGIRFKIKKNKNTLFNEVLANGGAPIPYDQTVDVEVDDTIRFVVKPRNNNNCDSTFVDPLIQVLPPETTGPIYFLQVSDPEDEAGDEPGSD